MCVVSLTGFRYQRSDTLQVGSATLPRAHARRPGSVPPKSPDNGRNLQPLRHGAEFSVRFHGQRLGLTMRSALHRVGSPSARLRCNAYKHYQRRDSNPRQPYWMHAVRW